MTEKKRHQELASKWLNGTITEIEKSEFRAWYDGHVDGRFEVPSSFAGSEEELSDRILMKIRENMHQEITATVKFRYRWIIGIAASILLFISIGVYFWSISSPKNMDSPLTRQDVEPGGNRATLMLADGRVVDLSADQSGIVIGKELAYNDGTAVLAHELPLRKNASRFMCLSTPKGGQYQITLPDGTRVWLNSASSLRYPEAFPTDRRTVILEGEAYFEVKNRSNVPFEVVSKGQVVEVLGTQFNINAYKDEKKIKTTLVEGSISVRPHVADQQIAHNIGSILDSKSVMILKPGEQAVLTEDGVQVNKVNTEEFTAWKDGYFYFRDATLQDVMKQFSRWYDVDIQYGMLSVDDGDLFVGKIPREVSLATAVQVIKGTGVQIEFSEKERSVVIKDFIAN